MINFQLIHGTKISLNQGEPDKVKIGRGVRQGSCMSPILFNLYGEYLMKEALAEVGEFKIGEQLLIRLGLRMIRPL